MDPAQVLRTDDGSMRCRECGFTYRLTRQEVIDGAEHGLEAVRTALQDVPESRRERRLEPGIWSINAYTAHLADAAQVILNRVTVIAEQNRPPLPWHDQDAAVEQGQQDHVAADGSAERLASTVEAFRDYLQSLPDRAWDRIGIHSKAGEVRLAEIAQDMPHELQHHAGDIRRIGAPV